MNFKHVVTPQGLSGGLCMFWKEAQHVVLVKYSNFLIEVEFIIVSITILGGFLRCMRV